MEDIALWDNRREEWLVFDMENLSGEDRKYIDKYFIYINSQNEENVGMFEDIFTKEEIDVFAKDGEEWAKNAISKSKDLR